MPKIPALPPMTSPDGADEVPIEDVSVTTTKYITLTKLKEWLQSLAGWITNSMLADDTIKGDKINWSATGADNGIWWEELGRATLGSAGDTITINPFAARKYLRVEYHIIASGSIITECRFNNDSGTNYNFQYFLNNSGGNVTSQTKLFNLSNGTSNLLGYIDIVNVAAKHKQFISQNAYTVSNPATVANYVSFWGMWGNTSDQITRVDFTNTDSGSFDVGSEIVILGHD